MLYLVFDKGAYGIPLSKNVLKVFQVPTGGFKGGGL